MKCIELCVKIEKEEHDDQLRSEDPRGAGAHQSPAAGYKKKLLINDLRSKVHLTDCFHPVLTSCMLLIDPIDQSIHRTQNLLDIFLD